MFKRHTTQQGAAVDLSTDSEGASPGGVPTWDEVVEEHSDRVFRLAYRLTGNRPDAEDLTQEVFVRVFRSLDSYTPGTFEGWLHRITTNLFLDGARRKQRIRFDALSDERALDVVVEGLVGVRHVRAGAGTREPVGALVGEGVEADPLLAARLVEEQVGGDAVQPALEGAGGVRRQRAEDAHEHLLGEVLGVVAVPGQAVGQPVDPVGVPRDDLVPGGDGILVRVGTELSIHRVLLAARGARL